MIYSDFMVNFNMHPLRGDLILLEDEYAIGQSIKNLVFTGKYERFYQPKLGAGVPQELFELMDDHSAYQIEQRIRETISQYEPRATNVDVRVKANQDNNEFSAVIVFRPINSLREIEIETIFRRVR